MSAVAAEVQPTVHAAFRSLRLERRIALAMARHTYGPKGDHTLADRIRCTRKGVPEADGLTDAEIRAVCLRSEERSKKLDVPSREDALAIVGAWGGVR